MSLIWATLGDIWYVTAAYNNHKRLWPSEVAASWGESFWTAQDLWRL